MLFSNSNEKEILEIISNIEKFIDAEINSFPKVVIKGRSSNRNILDKLNNLTEKLYKKHQEEFRIYGEIMLIAEKLGNGIICDKIHHMNTSNKKLNYIAKTINNLVDSLNSILGSDTKKILNVLESYSNKNFRLN